MANGGKSNSGNNGTARQNVAGRVRNQSRRVPADKVVNRPVRTARERVLAPRQTRVVNTSVPRTTPRPPEEDENTTTTQTRRTQSRRTS
jgi:hypothetical protein